MVQNYYSGGAFFEIYLTMVRTGENGPHGISALLVEKNTSGLSFGNNEEKMGWKSQPTAQVIFDDCHVSSKKLLGEENKGFIYAMQGLDGGRLNIAAAALEGPKQLSILQKDTLKKTSFREKFV